MAKAQIIFKLEELISSNPAWSEVEVTYLFVQIRKLLDHSRVDGQSESYDHIRFYCDWVVHIRKDRIGTATLKLIKDFETGMKSMIGESKLTAPGPINFAYFEAIQSELIMLFRTLQIPDDIFKDNESWISIMSNLVKVLENQPLEISPKHGLLIKSLEYQMSAPRTIWIRALFNQPFIGKDGNKYGYFDLKNVY